MSKKGTKTDITKKKKHKKKEVNSNKKIGLCHYHLCNKKEKLYRCNYCGEYFCKEHLEAKLPSIPNSKNTSLRHEIFREDSRKPGGHPCAPYFDFHKKEQERKREAYEESLGKLINSPPLKNPPEPKPPGEPEPPVNNPAVPIDLNRLIKIFWILLVLGILAGLVWLLSHNEKINIPFLSTPKCEDETHYNSCSVNKPYYCEDGILVKKASLCRCPYDYKIIGDDCEKIKRCSDKTVYGTCSLKRPLYCSDGILVSKSSVCGCPTDEIVYGESCVSKFMTNPSKRTSWYILNGKKDRIILTVYFGLKEYLSELSRSYYCNPDCPTDRELELEFIDQKEQKEYLKELIEKIRQLTDDEDDQARIAISFVQKIPYDTKGLENNDLNNRYPYEVIYDLKGVCGEKSRLLALILRELGFGVVLFNFENENHMAVGIKCPSEYDYIDTGYCFIETSVASIITNSEGDYVGVGKLSSTPDIINIGDGKSFDSVSEEYEDAKEWNKINKISETSGGVLDEYDYYEWESLVNKYDIELETNPTDPSDISIITIANILKTELQID